MKITVEQLNEELNNIDERPADSFQERMNEIEGDFESINEDLWYGNDGKWTKCPVFNAIDVVTCLVKIVEGCDDISIDENGEWELDWERKTVNALKRFCRKYAKKVEVFSDSEEFIVSEVNRRL